jgi:hypothetical protein
MASTASRYAKHPTTELMVPSPPPTITRRWPRSMAARTMSGTRAGLRTA